MLKTHWKITICVLLASWQLAVSANNNEVPTECPKATDPVNEMVHLAHESDCTKFYKCNDGYKIIMTCPAVPGGEQLHFNPRRQICDYPDQAGCHLNPTLPSTVECNANDTNNPIPTKVPTVCTEDITGIYFPHETYCSLYYECIYGDLIKRKCNDGLHFDNSKQICVQPWETNCQRTTSEVSATTPGLTPESATEKILTMDMSEIQDLCPVDGTDYCPFYPHECSCDKYYVCANGRLILQQCKKGWHFNSADLICEWPENAGCNSTSTSPTLPTEPTKPTVPTVPTKPTKPTVPTVPTKPTKPTVPTVPTKPTKPTVPTKPTKPTVPTKPTKPTVPTKPTKPTVPTVPNKPTKSTTPYPVTVCPPGSTWAHPKLCELYYQCEDDKTVIKECQGGLHFNPDKGFCDLPQNVNCTASCDCCKLPTIGTLDAIDCPEFFYIHIPHEKYNQLYYECNSGTKTLMECSEDHDFNPTLRQCELSKKTQCYN